MSLPTAQNFIDARDEVIDMTFYFIDGRLGAAQQNFNRGDKNGAGLLACQAFIAGLNTHLHTFIPCFVGKVIQKQPQYLRFDAPDNDAAFGCCAAGCAVIFVLQGAQFQEGGNGLVFRCIRMKSKRFNFLAFGAHYVSHGAKEKGRCVYGYL